MKIKRFTTVLMFYILIASIVLTATYWGSVATTAIAEKIQLERNNTVIIDAGHGGEDGGSTSCTGKLESAFNLEISHRLNDLFHLLGIHTIMVRTTDVSVYSNSGTIAEKKISDLKNRAKLVNETKNGLLLSIHQNTFPDSKCAGAQVFYGSSDDAKELAGTLQNRFVTELNKGSTRRSKKAEGIYLMEHIEKVGVLIECGFLSNPEEEAKLRDKSYQQKICCVIASTVCNFLDR